MKLKRVYLTGFMTSGKSTIGSILANVLGWDFIDLDDEIVQQTNKSIVQIFKDNGEEYFRKIESELLKEFSNRTKVVIALGGGAIISNTNLELLKSTGKTIYLKVSPETIFKRIKAKTNRPIFKDLVDSKNPKEVFIKRIKNLLIKREPYYSKADLTIDTDKYKLGQTVDLIANKLRDEINEEN
ncbi:shikimate kinase [Bacteroidota bacterium]